jgi:hypothetical protein
MGDAKGAASMFKQGQILTLEQGEYSDFQYAGPFRVLRDLDIQSVVDRFQSTVGRDKYPNAFIAWLATEGYIEDVGGSRWDLGSFNLEPEGYETTAEQSAFLEEQQAIADARIEADKKRRAPENPHLRHLGLLTTSASYRPIGYPDPID